MYAILAVAESLAGATIPPPQPSPTPAVLPRRSGDSDSDLLTVHGVAELTGLSEGTFRWWRQVGQGPKSIKLGRRVMYRRADVEKWLAEAES